MCEWEDVAVPVEVQVVILSRGGVGVGHERYLAL